jgi:hypothetical protein
VGEPTIIGPGPGQVVVKKEDTATEVKIPWQQVRRLAWCTGGIYLALSACVILAREAVMPLAALAGGGFICWRLWRQTENWVIAAFLAVTFGTIGLVAGVPLSRQLWHWLIAEHWLVLLEMWSIGFLLVVVIYPLFVGTYRYTGEIVDPGGPTSPRTAIAWPGVIWPWQVGKIFKSLNPQGAEPPARTERSQVELTWRTEDGNVRAKAIGTLLEGPDAIRRSKQLAKWILGGASISERSLAGKGRPLTGREEYQAFVEEMMGRGLAVWKDPSAHRQGIELTVVGRKVLASLAGGGNGTAPPHEERA